MRGLSGSYGNVKEFSECLVKTLWRNFQSHPSTLWTARLAFVFSARIEAEEWQERREKGHKPDEKFRNHSISPEDLRQNIGMFSLWLIIMNSNCSTMNLESVGLARPELFTIASCRNGKFESISMWESHRKISFYRFGTARRGFCAARIGESVPGRTLTTKHQVDW